MDEAVRASRRDWRHGVVACPSCGLHLDPVKDLDEPIVEDFEMTGVRGTHRRCGARFVLAFGKRE